MDYLATDDHLLQDREEFTLFCELLVKEGVRSYLEIGSWSGGSIEMVAEYLSRGSRIVSIDFPREEAKHVKLREVIGSLQRNGYLAYLFSGYSDDERAIITAQRLGPYDALFIDGGHVFECVKSDWENYGKLARIVGFHDIAIDKPPHGVSRLWQELKMQYRHVEFISEETRRQKIGYGIGVIWTDEPANG